MWMTLYLTCGQTTLTPVYYYTKNFVVIIDQEFWRNKDPVLPRYALIWFTDGSRAGSGTGSGIHGIRPERSFSFSLGKFATVFQNEIYAILQCACENIRRAYRNKRILIFSDSQAALKALNSPKVASRLVVECTDALSALADRNKVTLMWVPGHCVILCNETADKLARQGAAKPLLGPEPALGIPKCSAREAIKNWTECQHSTTWNNLPCHKNGKLFINGPCKKKADGLIKLSRNQLRSVAFLTGHAPVRMYLNIMGLFEGDLTCKFCGSETETVQRIICGCEALARQRYKIFGKMFVEPRDISMAPLKDLCLFIRGTGIMYQC
jgi:ribonuclease HI